MSPFISLRLKSISSRNAKLPLPRDQKSASLTRRRPRRANPRDAFSRSNSNRKRTCAAQGIILPTGRNGALRRSGPTEKSSVASGGTATKSPSHVLCSATTKITRSLWKPRSCYFPPRGICLNLCQVEIRPPEEILPDFPLRGHLFAAPDPHHKAFH